MRKSLRVVALLIPLVLVASNSYAAVKAGSACSKAGSKRVSGGKSYTCVKSGKKLVWDKGVLIPVAKPTPAPSNSVEPAPAKSAEPVVTKIDYNKTFSTDDGYYTDFSGPCQFDNNLTGQLAEIQTYFYNFNRCGAQLRVNKYALGNERPKASFDSALNFSNTEPCKIVTPKGVSTNRGFTTAEQNRNDYENLRKFPSPGAVIQLVPIYASDTEEPKNSPAEDYGNYLNILKDWLEYSADFNSPIEIRIPEKYIKMDSKLGDYKIFHENHSDSPNHVAFNKDLIATTDPVIDYRGANIAIIVPPAGTDVSVFGQATIGSLQTNEGFVAIGMTQYAHLAANPSRSRFSTLGHPFWWIHEMFHAGIGFDDHYGDTQRNINTEYGMGELTMMTPFGGDLTTWEKWRLGFMRDSQVQCVSSPGTSTHWIAPSTVKTSASKAVVIKISDTKIVVVETLRPAGLYYKLPKQSQGALVYEVDLLETRHGLGFKLALPLGRTVTSDGFFMSSYPLKQGDATETNGYRISIVEAGTYGDVVKVEKVA